MRRSRASHLIAGGAGFDVVSAWLRHRRAATTVRYLDLLAGDVDPVGAASVLLGDGTGWTPPPARTPGSIDAGWADVCLEELAAATEDVLTVERERIGPETRAAYEAWVARFDAWQAQAGTVGDDADVARWLVWEMDTSSMTTPESLRPAVAAMEWHLGAEPGHRRRLGVARDVFEGLIATHPGARKRPNKATIFTVGDLERIVGTVPWTNRTCVLARSILGRALGNTHMLARLTGQHVTVKATGVHVTDPDTGQEWFLPGEDDPVRDVRWAADKLIEEGGPFATSATLTKLRHAMGVWPEQADPAAWDTWLWDKTVPVYLWCRNTAAVACAYGAAFEVGDLIALDWDDLEPVPAGIRDRRTGRVIRAGTGALDPVAALARLARAHPWAGGGLHGRTGPVLAVTPKAQDENLDPTRPPGRVDKRTLDLDLKKRARQIGLPKFNIRSVRATAAVHLAERGGTVEAVRELLGHADIARTRAFLADHGADHDNPTRPDNRSTKP